MLESWKDIYLIQILQKEFKNTWLNETEIKSFQIFRKEEKKCD